MQDTEIDVTPLFAAPGFDPWDCSNLCASLGQDAGELAWRASQRFASSLSLTAEQKDAFRDFVRGSVSSTFYLHGGKLFWSFAQ